MQIIIQHVLFAASRQTSMTDSDRGIEKKIHEKVRGTEMWRSSKKIYSDRHKRRLIQKQTNTEIQKILKKIPNVPSRTPSVKNDITSIFTPTVDQYENMTETLREEEINITVISKYNFGVIE